MKLTLEEEEIIWRAVEFYAKKYVKLAKMFYRGKADFMGDLVGEGWRAVLEKLPRFNPEKSSLRTFASRQAQWGIIKYLRRERRWVERIKLMGDIEREFRLIDDEE